MEPLKIRKPAVAGQFYPSSAQELRKQIGSFVGPTAEKLDAVACMLPHAGYVYSGKVAAETLSRISIKEKVILLGPNHTGNGAPFSIMTRGRWQTPLGEVNIDSALAEKILCNSRYFQDDSLAHMYEHSLEVELPLLQYFRQDFQIVPIAFLSDSLVALKRAGTELAAAINGSGAKDSILLLASSDMTHYEPQEEAARKDKEAIAAILELDEDKLMRKIGEFHISMCGFAPVIVMLKAAKALGAKSASLARYQTSGDVTGDKTSVVGYAGIIIH